MKIDDLSEVIRLAWTNPGERQTPENTAARAALHALNDRPFISAILDVQNDEIVEILPPRLFEVDRLRHKVDLLKTALMDACGIAMGLAARLRDVHDDPQDRTAIVNLRQLADDAVLDDKCDALDGKPHAAGTGGGG